MWSNPKYGQGDHSRCCIYPCYPRKKIFNGTSGFTRLNNNTREFFVCPKFRNLWRPQQEKKTLISPSCLSLPLTPHRIRRGCVTYATGRGRALRVKTTTSASVRPSVESLSPGQQTDWGGAAGQVDGRDACHTTGGASSRVGGNVIGRASMAAATLPSSS